MKEGFRQAMAWLHTWTGLIFGWLLFAIFLTGTLAYFKDEISHWMQPEIPARSVSSEASLALAQDYLQQHAPGASRWLIDLPSAREPGLSVRWQQSPAKRGERGQFTEKRLDAQTGTEVQGRETRGGEFFYRFHYQLQMPYPWGRWLSTIAAMVMFIGLITGIITHKKIFKDFFTFRPRKGQRSWLDGHNAVGVLVLISFQHQRYAARGRQLDTAVENGHLRAISKLPYVQSSIPGFQQALRSPYLKRLGGGQQHLAFEQMNQPLRTFFADIHGARGIELQLTAMTQRNLASLADRAAVIGEQWRQRVVLTHAPGDR